ncbi:hypothetical protein V8F33_005988 [Rhypophila sp. PSN 637]
MSPLELTYGAVPSPVNVELASYYLLGTESCKRCANADKGPELDDEAVRQLRLMPSVLLQARLGHIGPNTLVGGLFCVDLVERVIPRLLRPLETDGGTIDPVLVYGNLDYGDFFTDMSEGAFLGIGAWDSRG